MTTHHAHPHAESDRFPLLLESLAQEFGRDGILSVAERFIEAESADFHWEGRFAERNLGAYEGFTEDDEEAERVEIIGYFRQRYYVATCIVDAGRRVGGMLNLRHFDSFETAKRAFLASGG